nr:MAG TPA: hypothetical protein [Caudoviricetes sp.]
MSYNLDFEAKKEKKWQTMFLKRFLCKSYMQ